MTEIKLKDNPFVADQIYKELLGLKNIQNQLLHTKILHKSLSPR